MSVVFDACSMIAFLRDEPGADVVDHLFMNQTCFAHSINVCELYYDFYRAAGKETAEQAVSDLISLKLTIREDMDQSFWKDVGQLKATIKRVSIADCFSIALGRRTNSEIVTSDHHEFDKIVEMNVCKITFIR